MIPNAFTFRKTRHPEYRTVLSCLAALAFLLLGAPAGATDHSGAITADATWLAADNPHVIVSSVIVQAGATLTLQPGVQVVGNSGQLLQIQGQLQAQGLSGQEITLDRNAATGTWGGIYVQTAGTIDLDHCVIDNAYYGISHGSSGAVALNNCSISGGSYGIYATGSGPIQLASTTISGAIISGFQGTGIAPTFLDGASVFAECVTGIRINNVNGLNWTSAVTVENCSATGVYLANCDTPSLNNLILRDNTGTNGALMLDNCGDFTLGAGNQIGGSGDENTWPVSMTAGSYPSAGCIIPTTGNTNNDIRVHAGASDHSGVWRKFADLDYIITASPQVQAGGSLTIEPQVRVLSNSGQGLAIYGELIAEAGAGQEIVLDRNGATGSWAGIYVQGGGTASLDHCLLDYGYYGINQSSTGTTTVANTTITHAQNGIRAANGQVQLASCLISDSAYGFFGAGVQPTLLDSATLFQGNGTGIYLSNLDQMVWSTPAVITGSTSVGMHLANCLTPSLDNLVMTDNTGTNGAFMMDNCGDFTLGAGNQIGGSGDENTWPVSMTAGSYPSAGCIIPTTGNTNNDIRVHAGASDHSGVWRKFADLDYIITASPQVQAGGSLTIEPRVRVLCNSGQGLAIYGELIAEAEAGQEIVLDRNGATGSWAGIYVQGGGTASLDHCLLDYGYYGINQNSTGTTTVASTVITHAQNGIRAANGQVQLASCLISDSAYGFFGAGVQPTLLDSATLFQGNGTGIYLSNLDGLVWTAPATITGSTTTGLHLVNCSEPSLDNLVMTDNTGTNGAFMMDNCGDFTLGAGNQIGGSGDENTWPVSMTAGSYPSAGCVIPTTGNTNNDIRVHAGASDRSGAWRKFADLDYVITGTPQVQAGGSLTIEPTVQVLCNTGQGLAIYGELIAEAEAGQEIVLDRNGATGSWAGIYVQGGGTASLDHCLLDYGYYGINQNSTGTTTVASTVITHAQNGIRATGGQIRLGSCQFTDSVFGFYGDGVRPTLLDAASTFDGNGTGVYLRNLGGLVWSTRITITGSTTTGLHLVNCSEPSLNNLVLTGNTGVNGALMLDNCGDFTLGAGNQIGGEGSENTWPVSITAGSYPAAGCVIPLRGNTSNDIRVHAGASDRSGTWRKFPGLDYIITASPQVQAGGTLTIDPMVHVLCHSGQGLSIYGTLTTLGELGKMVLFDRVGASGTWSGIYVQGAGEANLAHCRIDHANYGVYHNTSGTSQLTHNILRNGQTGLYLLAGTVNLLHNRIHDNLQYGIYISGGTPVFGSIPEQWNDIHGNGSGNAGRALRNGPDDLTAAYVYWGTVLSEEISTAITDNADDANLGVVTFIPFSDAAHDPQSPVHDPQEVPGTLPERFDLAQNYPNPFNPRTAIAFDLTRASAVKLEIFNLAGARVVTLVDEVLPAGRYRQVWDGRDGLGRAQASGVFFYRITSDEGTLTRRMTMVR